MRRQIDAVEHGRGCSDEAGAVWVEVAHDVKERPEDGITCSRARSGRTCTRGRSLPPGMRACRGSELSGGVPRCRVDVTPLESEGQPPARC